MQGATRLPSILVIGVGNEFRRDDGVGWAIVDLVGERARRRPLPPGTELRACDGEPARLLSLWERAHAAIVLDASRTDGPSAPGHVRRFASVDGIIRRPGAATSSHGLGLAAAVELSLVLRRLPPDLVLYTVESGDAGEGVGLSEPVRAAVEPVARCVEREVRRLARRATRPSPAGGRTAPPVAALLRW